MLQWALKTSKRYLDQESLAKTKAQSNFNIPIGLEVSSADDLSITKSITIDIKDGTLEDVLQSIMNHNPLYSWEIRDNVVNVFPQEANRDLLLKQALETKLEKVSIHKETRRFPASGRNL